MSSILLSVRKWIKKHPLLFISTIVVVTNAVPLIALSDVAFFSWIRGWILSLGHLCFGDDKFGMGMAGLAITISLSAIAILLFVMTRELSAAIAAKREQDEREVIDTYVVLAALITGVIAAGMVFLVEYGKGGHGGADGGGSFVLELALAATAGILVALFVFVGSIVFAFDRRIGQEMNELDKAVERVTAAETKVAEATIKVEDASAKVDEGTSKLNAISQATENVVNTAHRTLHAFAGIEPAMLKDLGTKVGDGFSEYFLAMLDWTRQGGPSDRAVLPGTLMQSYLLEEAYDIRRRHVVTNPRNYTTFLIDIMFELAKVAKADNCVLQVRVVTPVAPIYLCNWPQRAVAADGEVQCAYMLPFLQQYYLFTNELLSSDFQANLSIGRYLLVATSKIAKPPSCELAAVMGVDGFELDDQSHLLPVPVTVSLLRHLKFTEPEIKAIVKSSCIEPHSRLTNRSTTDAPKIIESCTEMAFFPLISENSQKILDRFTTDTARMQAATYWRQRYEALTRNLVFKRAVPGIQQAIEKVDSALKTLEVANGRIRDPDVIRNFFRDLQRLTLLLVSSELPSQHVEQVYEVVIEYRTALLWASGAFDSPAAGAAPPTVSRRSQPFAGMFARLFHSPDKARGGYEMHRKLVGPECPRPNEFVLFGLSRLGKDPEWLVGITASIDHPWRSAEVNVEFAGEHEPFKRLILAFEETKNLKDAR